MAAVEGEAWLRRTRMLEKAIATAPVRAQTRTFRSVARRRSIPSRLDVARGADGVKAAVDVQDLAADSARVVRQ